MTTIILMAWPSATIPKLLKDTSWHITEEEASYFTVITSSSMIIASPIMSYIVDKIGRKWIIILGALSQVMAWICVMTAGTIYIFYLSRIFDGIGIAAFYASVPVYLGEICRPNVRETWTHIMIFMMYLGPLFANALGSFLSVRNCAFVLVFLPGFTLIAFPLMPDSPVYHTINEQYKKARASLRIFSRKRDVEEDFEQLKRDVERQMSETGSWKDLFTIKSNKRALAAGIFLKFTQQVSGITAFLAYTQKIYEKSGQKFSSSTCSIIVTSSLCTFIILGTFVLNKFGYRLTYLISLFWCGLTLAVEAAYFYLDQFHPEINLSRVNWIPLIDMIVFSISYGPGLAIVPVIMPGELFSVSIKAKGMLLLNVEYALCLLIFGKLFFFLVTHFGMYSSFLVFSIGCFISTALTHFVLPETSGKTLEEIQQYLAMS